MDGSHRQVLIDSHIKWPNGITLDRADRRLFWVDAKMDIIGSCDYGYFLPFFLFFISIFIETKFFFMTQMDRIGE